MKHELTEEQKERFNRLIKAVEKGIEYKGDPVLFDLEIWIERHTKGKLHHNTLKDGVFLSSECGTVACIHGHACIEFEKEIGIDACAGAVGGFNRRATVAILLGVPSKEYTNLCLGPLSLDPELVTREHAVEAIKHLKYNGRMSDMRWEAIVNG